MKALAGIQAVRGKTGEQGVRAGSIYLALALGLSGVLTYVFHSVASRALGPERYGAVATLWSATFLCAQVLWVGATQTLGRYVAERRAKGEAWAPVVRGVWRMQAWLFGAFLGAAAVFSAALTRLFGGEWTLTAAFVAAVAGYGLVYQRRGILSGHRQFRRLGAALVLESGARALLVLALLAAGTGRAGAATALAAAPLLSWLVVRPAPVPEPVPEPGPTPGDAPFEVGGALRFAAPVLLSMACAQAIANGGPLLIGGLGGPDAQAQAGLLFAALVLTRIPQFILSPVISNLLPHLSRLWALDDHHRFDRLVGAAAALIGLAGAGLVGGMWLFGELALRLFSGPEFRVGRGLLTLLAALAACYLLAELLTQVLYARNRARLAACAWVLGVAVSALAAFLGAGELLGRVSLALALGAGATATSLALFHLGTRLRGGGAKPSHP